MARRYYRRYPQESDLFLTAGGLIILLIFPFKSFFSTDREGLRIFIFYSWTAVILLLVLFLFFWLHQRKIQEQKRKALRMVDIYQMSGTDFEQYLIFLLSRRGFTKIKHTKLQGDFGADLIATKDGKKYAIQAKCWKAPVGVDAIYQCLGGQKYYACDETMIITNSRFTLQAKLLALRSNTTLVDRDGLASWILEMQKKRN